MDHRVRHKRRREARLATRRSRQHSKGSGRWVLAAALAVAGIAGYFGWSFVSRNSPEIISYAQGKASSDQEDLVGRASVIDGDTIEIHGKRIRFNGIDAPESSQTCADGNGKAYRCGAKAAEAVDQFLAASSPTRCVFVARDRYSRFVGNCFRADGESVQAALVRDGWALDWPRYSKGAYAELQETAKAEGKGIWIGAFERPWEWRADRRNGKAATAPIVPLVGVSSDSDGCNIKGNINSSGERIYHVPGQEHYDRTQITLSKGERWFCSEAEALAAGWRPALR